MNSFEPDDRKRLAHLQKSTQQHTVLIGMALQHKFTRGAEIGVLRGKTLFALLDACPELSMIAVDQWRHIGPREDECAETYTQFDMNALRASVISRAQTYKSNGEARCLILEGDSVEMADHVHYGSLDFVFLDGDHTEAGLSQDLRAWAPKVRDGGLVMGHDWSWPTVRRVLDRDVPGWSGLAENVWLIPRADLNL